MRWIDKILANEPGTLRAYRSTPNATYKGFVDSDQLLKKALCKEQGYLCCYCMRRLSTNSVSVEHYITQSKHQDSPFSEDVHFQNQLKYSNLLASCNDKWRNCSGIRGDIPISSDPTNSEIEQKIGWLKNGKAYSIYKDQAIERDIEKTLRLNEETLKVNRASIIKKVRADCEKHNWQPPKLKTLLRNWKSLDKEGQYNEYCQVAIEYLSKKLAKRI